MCACLHIWCAFARAVVCPCQNAYVYVCGHEGKALRSLAATEPPQVFKAMCAHGIQQVSVWKRGQAWFEAQQGQSPWYGVHLEDHGVQ